MGFNPDELNFRLDVLLKTKEAGMVKMKPAAQQMTVIGSLSCFTAFGTASSRTYSFHGKIGSALNALGPKIVKNGRRAKWLNKGTP